MHPLQTGLIIFLATLGLLSIPLVIVFAERVTHYRWQRIGLILTWCPLVLAGSLGIIFELWQL